MLVVVWLLAGVNTWSCVQFVAVLPWVSWRGSSAESSHWFRYGTSYSW